MRNISHIVLAFCSCDESYYVLYNTAVCEIIMYYCNLQQISQAAGSFIRDYYTAAQNADININIYSMVVCRVCIHVIDFGSSGLPLRS